MPTPAEIAATILRLTQHAGPGKSIAPSDVAQALDPNWQPLLGSIRRAAAQLAAAGQIDILRKGKPIDPADMRGVIRLRLHPKGESPASLLEP